MNNVHRASHESKKALQPDDLGRRLKEAQTLIDECKEKYEQERAAERKRAKEKKQVGLIRRSDRAPDIERHYGSAPRCGLLGGGVARDG